MRRSASRATTGGVSTTASAKLNVSARTFDTPASIPVEIVAPERENPRKGKQRPCTKPIHPACLAVIATSPDDSETACRRLKKDAARIRMPAAASAGAISSRWLNNCSASACSCMIAQAADQPPDVCRGIVRSDGGIAAGLLGPAIGGAPHIPASRENRLDLVGVMAGRMSEQGKPLVGGGLGVIGIGGRSASRTGRPAPVSSWPSSALRNWSALSRPAVSPAAASSP